MTGKEKPGANPRQTCGSVEQNISGTFSEFQLRVGNMLCRVVTLADEYWPEGAEEITFAYLTRDRIGPPPAAFDDLRFEAANWVSLACAMERASYLEALLRGVSKEDTARAWRLANADG